VTIRLGAFEDLNFIVGARFPRSDEDALWRCADAWGAAATELRRLRPEAVAAGLRALDALGGEPGDAFAELWRRVTDDGEGFIDQLARACEELAAACDETARQVEYAKIQYIVALVLLAATLAYLAALAVVGGLGAVGIPMAIAVAQFTIRTVLLRLVSAVVFGAALSVSVDGVAQSVQILRGRRDQWDWALTRRAAEDGAIYGASAGGLFLGFGRLGLSNLSSGIGAAGLSGTVGGVASPLLHGETPTWEDVLASTTSALLGGVGRRPGPGEVPIPHLDGPDLGPLSTLDPGALGSLDPSSTDGRAPLDSRSLDSHSPDAPDALGRPPSDPPPADAAPPVEPRPDGSVAPIQRPTPEPTPDLGPTLAGDPPGRPPGPTRTDLLAPPPPPGAVAGPAGPPEPGGGTGGPAPVIPGVAGGPPPPPSPSPPAPPGVPASGPAVLNPQAPAPPSAPSPLSATSAPAAPPAPLAHPAPGAPSTETGPSAPSAGITAAAVAGVGGPVLGRPPLSGPADLPPADADPASPARPGDDGTAAAPGDVGVAGRLSLDEAVSLARQHAFTTNAGLAFYPDGDSIRSFAHAIHPTDGFVTLDLHGSSHGFQIDNRVLSPEQFAAALRSLEADGMISLADGVGIKLLSCDTAAGGPDSVAARLARALGVEVIAPDTAVWTTPDGTEIVASAVLDHGIWIPKHPPDGAWHHFDPHGTETLLDDLPVADQTDAETRSRSHGENEQPRAPDSAGDSGQVSGAPGDGPTLSQVDWGNPRTFDPAVLRGARPADVESAIPSAWQRVPSTSGSGTMYRDPHHYGRTIRVMPGYPTGNRPDPLTHGPYVVVSQNGATIKVALAGNPTLTEGPT
jgi:hypothetical protein